MIEETVTKRLREAYSYGFSRGFWRGLALGLLIGGTALLGVGLLGCTQPDFTSQAITDTKPDATEKADAAVSCDMRDFVDFNVVDVCTYVWDHGSIDDCVNLDEWLEVCVSPVRSRFGEAYESWLCGDCD